jgi:hypothetical protein
MSCSSTSARTGSIGAGLFRAIRSASLPKYRRLIDPTVTVGAHDDQIRSSLVHRFQDGVGGTRRYGLDDAGFRLDAGGHVLLS